ncbi:hypothetical protein K24_15520, partial [Klebsiella pneumoniae]
LLQADLRPDLQGGQHRRLLLAAGDPLLYIVDGLEQKLDNYANDDALGSNGFKSGGEWSFGMQMETWF